MFLLAKIFQTETLPKYADPLKVGKMRTLCLGAVAALSGEGLLQRGMMPTSMDIVLPCLNEERILPQSVPRLHAFLSKGLLRLRFGGGKQVQRQLRAASKA